MGAPLPPVLEVRPPAELFAGPNFRHPCQVALVANYVWSLPTKARGNYAFFFTYRFSRGADIYSTMATEFTAEGTVNILVNCSGPLLGCTSTLMFHNGPKFRAQLATSVEKILSVYIIPRSAEHPSGYGSVKRVNHTMVQVLSMACNEYQNDWDGTNLVALPPALS